MNLTEAKDQIAQRMGFSNWKRFEIYVKPTPEIMDEAMKLYASEKVKEALQVAAERMPSKDTGRSGCFYGDTDMDSESVAYGYNLAIDYCSEHILSLLPELVQTINKEI